MAFLLAAPKVELAQVEYQLPRLTRMWSHLDRVGGGGQVKGTGEKQIEIDKRLLRDKAAHLRRWGGVEVSQKVDTIVCSPTFLCTSRYRGGESGGQQGGWEAG